MIHYRHWIALERARGIGPAAMKEIADTITPLSLSIADLFGCSETEIRGEFTFPEPLIRGIVEAQGILPSIEEEYLDISDAGIKPLLFFEEGYPKILHERLGSQIPPVLYTLGNRSLMNSRGAAILGHADTSEKGGTIAWGAARECARSGVTVFGGISKGAGSSAHTGALENGGSTVGIIPCGFLTFDLSARLKALFDPDRFLIASPFNPKEEYNQFNAMNRNRIICALSRAVFIVEAPKEGGIFEAAKSAAKLSIPLYTAEYAQYPESAEGNPVLMKEFSASPVRGRKEGTAVVPNVEAMIAAVKFGRTGSA
jgi:DNA processing protein